MLELELAFAKILENKMFWAFLLFFILESRDTLIFQLTFMSTVIESAANYIFVFSFVVEHIQS